MMLLLRNIFLCSLLMCEAHGVFAQKDIPILNHKNKIKITELTNLNSTMRETNLSVSPDGKFLYFMSDRGGQPWSHSYGAFRGKKRYDGDIWFSEKVNGSWSNPQCLSQQINTEKGEDEPNISQDGQTVYFQSWKERWQFSSGPYYVAQLKGKDWLEPQGMGGGIAMFFQREFNKYMGYATDGMSVSPDGNLFIVAAGSNYDGNLDFYTSQRTEEGKWGAVTPLTINTAKDERSAFIAADGKTLYFASNGYGGFGGLDIFKASLQEDGIWGNVMNIGAPFNTEKDDYGFIITASGKEAYFVRDGDIFYADLQEGDENIKPNPSILISGIVRSKCDNEFMEATIQVRNAQTQKVITQARSNSYTGHYAIIAPFEKIRYELVFCAENHDTLRIALQTPKEKLYVEMKHSIFLECDSDSIPNEENPPALQKEEKLVILFDFDSYALREEEKQKLRDFCTRISSQESYTIYLQGHTDNKGNLEYNQRLSAHRNKSVLNFLKSCGISESLFEQQKYGEQNPIDSNDSEEGRQNNRRVEIILYKK